MKLKFVALAVMLAGSLSQANAGLINGNVTPDIVLTPNATNPNYLAAGFGNAPIGAPVTGAFTDVYTFTPSLAGGGWGSGAVINFALYNFGDLGSISASLNGNAFTASAAAPYVFTLDPVLLSPGPLTLTISGIVSSAGGGYGGNLNVLAVPEPETYGMMLGGLALLGYMARRRKQQG